MTKKQKRELAKQHKLEAAAYHARLSAPSPSPAEAEPARASVPNDVQQVRMKRKVSAYENAV